MAKNRKSAQPFGSRKNTTKAALVRGNVIKFNSEINQWFDEMETLHQQATSLPASATIVTRYNRDYGAIVPDTVGLNDATQALASIVKNHNEACQQHKANLEELRAGVPGRTRDNTRTLILTWGMALQDIMNDWNVVGMYAIDNVLDYFRELAKTDDSIPFPGYMIMRKEDDVSITDQYGDQSGAASTRLILDVPKEGETQPQVLNGELPAAAAEPSPVLDEVKE